MDERVFVRLGSDDTAVPAVSRFFGIVIAMYSTITATRTSMRVPTGRGAKVRIDTLEVMSSSLDRRALRLVLAWAELHQEALAENWRRARSGETLHPIEPLR